jgi:hypothetical protein
MASGELTRDEAHRTWFILREPNRVPERKGPFPPAMVKGFLLELMGARPDALITVLSTSDDCPCVQDGPECLEMIDGRYRARAARHRKTSRAAWAAKAGDS